jgi:large subunit ribosomal protein L31
MKKGIHPELVDCTVTCACGNSFTTKSQKPEMRIDICNECHPFFTGEERMVDTAGRIEKFNARYNKNK